ncbi:MAG TPA: HAMP domain-containing sensor histidine kinase, partial [Polyangiaceae bacterium]
QVAARERDSLVSLVRKEEEHASLVVHDLKSPLTNILFSAQFLSEEAQDEEKREAAEGILSSVRHLHRLVMSLLDLGQAGDDVALKLETTDIGGVLHDVANEATTRLRALGREVRVRSELASTIDVDATMIRRVVENLVDNAIKYSRGTITLEARDHDGDIQIDVRDEGEGIPAGERVRVFERCKRLDRDVAIDRTSRGLGLAFCKLAVEAHGGRIWIDDNRPRGAVFHVRLPTAASRASGERFRAEVATTPKRRVAGK